MAVSAHQLEKPAFRRILTTTKVYKIMKLKNAKNKEKKLNAGSIIEPPFECPISRMPE